MRLFYPAVGAAVLLFAINSSGAFAQSGDIQSSFKTPPGSAWPRAWWHWTNGNVSQEGITKDMEWAKRVGIKGLQMGDVASGGGQTVANKVNFGTPEWLDALKHAATEAKRLDLEFSMFTSAGWSLTGGPWVKPEQAMKKVVWSEIRVDGSKGGAIKLKQPPSQEGAGPLLEGGTPRPGFYKDVAVLAFKTPEADMMGDGAVPTVTTAKGVVADAATLFDQDINSGITVPLAADKTAWIQLAYNTPFHARAITLGARGRGIAIGKLQVSNDGTNFKTIITTPGKLGYRPGNIRTYAFPEVTAKYFRLVFTAAAPQPGEIINETTTLPIGDYPMTEITLHSGARIDRWQEKANFNQLFEYSNTDTPPEPESAEIKKEGIIDLTSKMAADGILNWTPPAGNWTIMRFGYALTGAKNRPAVPAGSGYEADKMSVSAVTSYMDNYTAPLKKAMGPLYGHGSGGLQYMVMDSWEAGITNWTPLMPEEFKKRRGYDMMKYLPAIAGHVVDDPKTSERFLWDFRRTIVDMIAENHYGTATKYLEKDGIGVYSEAGGVSLETTEDALLNKKFVTIPMGEFWVRDLHPSSMYYEDVRGAASASHIYGKGLVAAESFTGGNYEAPNKLKNIADYWFTQGVNRMVFHTSAHQPMDTKPGNTMVGTHINRNITWAELGRPFMTYLARNMYMLQRGTYSADIVYLLNEGAPATMPFWGAGVQPATPEGYSFDYTNADGLLTRMKTDDKGNIVLPDGLKYSILVLPPSEEMTLPVLRKIRDMALAGATIVGPKPTKCPSLTGSPNADDELKEITFDMWGDLDGISRTTRTYGKGKVYWGMPLQKVLMNNGVIKDVDDHRTIDEVSFIHRHDGDKEIYLLTNRTDSVQDMRVKFRVTGKEATFFHPDNGMSEPASYQFNPNNTEVPVHMTAHSTIYVVFDKPTTQATRVIPQPVTQFVGNITGPWTLTFPNGWGAPTAPQTVANLESWTKNADAGIKYFSGTATYTKTFDVKPGTLKGKMKIDLGKVGDIAVVTVNGSKPDTLWKAPYITDLGSALKVGKNTIVVKVTNEWTNRIAGDAQAPADKKVLAPGPPAFGGGGRGGAAALPESGLLGPVKLWTDIMPATAMAKPTPKKTK